MRVRVSESGRVSEGESGRVGVRVRVSERQSECECECE